MDDLFLKTNLFLSGFTKSYKSNNDEDIIQFIHSVENMSFNDFMSKIIEERNLFIWSKPSSKQKFVAINHILKITNDKAPKFLSNSENFEELNFPDLLCQLKFTTKARSNDWEAFNELDWFVPRLIIFCNNDKTYVIINILKKELTSAEIILEEIKQIFAKNKSHSIDNFSKLSLVCINYNDFFEWQKNIEKIIHQINNGAIKKAVLTRMVEYKLNTNVNLISLLDKLEQEHPEDFIFLNKRNDSVFFGASPEQLISFSRNLIKTEALAGTIKRGKTDKEDEELAKTILCDSKELEEHEYVLKYITKKLSRFATKINFDKKPQIKKLKLIQHLWTPITAELNREESIMSIVNQLHPTPAVCGDPKDVALKIISECENFDRGLFSGIIGWFNQKGLGEFTVAIRSALINGNKLLVFAGCGIVKNSDASKEFKETELKLKSVLSLFQNEKIS